MIYDLYSHVLYNTVSYDHPIKIFIYTDIFIFLFGSTSKVWNILNLINSGHLVMNFFDESSNSLIRTFIFSLFNVGY